MFKITFLQKGSRLFQRQGYNEQVLTILKWLL